VLKEKLEIFLIDTLLLHIPLLALTDGQNYGETNTLATRGLEDFFPVVLLCQFFVLAGKRFLVLHTTYVLRVPYSCGVVLGFLFWREIGVGVTYCTIQLCGCVSFLLWRES
jgi:hypothetical protein